MAYEWQSDIIRPDGENGTEVLDTNGVYQPQIEGGDNITIEDGKISASGTLENVQADYTETDTSAPSYIKHKPDLSIYATASGMETELSGKQDVIEDLSTIRSGAEAGSTAVQPGDLAAVATTGSYTSLTNTPQNIVQDASYVHTDNNFTNADKGKLDGIAAGAEVNVQSDWDEADPSSDAYIANKPTIPAAQINSDWNASSGVAQILNKPDLSAYATDSELTDGLATKQDIISDLDSIRAGAAAGATAAQPSDLPSSDELLPSATSGDAGKILSVDSNGDPEWITPSGGTTYSAGDGVSIDANNVISADVDGTTIGIDSTTKKIKSLQVIPTKTSDLQNDSNFVVASSLATVATSGSYADLSNKPVIPTKTSDLQNDSNFVSSGSLATVATTGSYNDLSNKPVIPPGVTVDQTYSASSTNAQSGTAVAGAIAGVKQVPASTSADENKVLTVNSSGNPVWENSAVPESKPLVAGSNITITENTNDVTISATATTYTAGDGIDITSGVVSADVDGTTIGIDSTTKKIKSLQVIPTKTSDLQNDSNFVVASSLATVATSGSYADLSNKPAIPTKTSDLQNDSNFVSSSSLATVATSGNYSDLSGKPTIPSVDQTYNASSTNAQSGTAVAQAIASIPSSSYTAGDGIAIESGEISVDYDSNTLDTVVGVSTESVTAVNHSTYGAFFVLPTDISNMASGSDNVQITLHIPGNTFYFASSADPLSYDPLSYYPAHVGFAELRTSQATGNLYVYEFDQYLAVNLTGTFDSAAQKCWLNEQDVSITLPASVANNWAFDYNAGRVINGLVFSLYNQYSPVDFELLFKCDSDTLTNPVTFTYSGGSHEVLTVKNPLPASTSADANKVLTVDSNGAAGWQNVPAPSVDEVPDVTSSDDGKILTASYSGGTGSYSWQPASGGGSSYTAGDGIAIESGEISVDYDSDTLDTVAGTITESVSQVDIYEGFTLPTSIQQMQTQNAPVNVSVHIPANTFRYNGNKDDMIFTFALCRGTSARSVNSYVDAPLAYTEASSNVYWIDEQTIVLTLPTLQTNGWEYDTNQSVKESFNVVGLQDGSHNFLTTINDGGALSAPITFTYSGGSHEVLTVKNPLPASAQADSGKVLKVNASGNAEWGTASGTTYTAGNMISIDANSNNAIGVSTTAGITDIQVVQSVPALAFPTVLYLIPET